MATMKKRKNVNNAIGNVKHVNNINHVFLVLNRTELGHNVIVLTVMLKALIKNVRKLGDLM